MADKKHHSLFSRKQIQETPHDNQMVKYFSIRELANSGLPLS